MYLSYPSRCRGVLGHCDVWLTVITFNYFTVIVAQGCGVIFFDGNNSLRNMRWEAEQTAHLFCEAK